MVMFGEFYASTAFGHSQDGQGPSIPIKDCWRIISMEARSSIPVGNPSPTPGKTSYSMTFHITVKKDCECLPRGEEPINPESRRDPNGRSTGWNTWTAATKDGRIVVKDYNVIIECMDCERFVEPPNSGGSGPFTIKYCEPDWGPERLQSRFDIPALIEIDSHLSITGPKALHDIGVDLAGQLLDHVMGRWYNDTSLHGARANGFTKSCCEAPDVWDR